MSTETSLAKFDKVLANVAIIQDLGNFLPDMSTKEGYEASKRFVLDETTPARTELTAAHKEAKAYWKKGGDNVDTKKNELLALLVEIQEPHQTAYKKVDQEKKDKKLKFDADLQIKIDVFHGYPQRAVGLSSDEITLLIDECGETDTQEGFYHRGADACKARQDALDFLNEALMVAVNREAEEQRQAELAEENRLRQIQIDEQQEAMRLQQEKMDAQQVEIDRVANEAATKAQAADEKQRLIDEAQRIETEKQQAIEREEYAKQQSEAAAEQARLAEQARQQKAIDEQKAKDDKRASNNRHVSKIKGAAKKSLMALGIDAEKAVEIVQALSHGDIDHCSINY
jgi:hypothetical protein